jgi:hypothetical protein
MRRLADIDTLCADTLVRARHLAGGPPRHALACRVAARLDVPQRGRALADALTRIERGRDLALDRAVIEALAAELDRWSGVDLTEPYRWVFRVADPAAPRDPMTWCGGRLPVFTSAFAAHRAQAAGTGVVGWYIGEVFYTELMVELGDDERRMLVDPDRAAVHALGGLAAAA